MPKIPANGIEVYYEIRGDGDPLLLIAGFACDHTIWSLVLPALAKHYRVVVFDNRGVGQSSGADTISSIRQLAADAAGLLDAIGLRSAHVAGHSMGGLIAQELALARPQLVQSLTLLASGTQVDERGQAIVESWGELPRLVDAATATRLILPWMYTNALYARPGAVAQIINQILLNPYPTGVQAIADQCRAIGAHRSSDRLGEIGCPTLALVGREDILLPVACSEQLVQAIRGAELVILERTGHGLLIESPDAVSQAMLDFLGRQHASISNLTTPPA